MSRRSRDRIAVTIAQFSRMSNNFSSIDHFHTRIRLRSEVLQIRGMLLPVDYLGPNSPSRKNRDRILGRVGHLRRSLSGTFDRVPCSLPDPLSCFFTHNLTPRTIKPQPAGFRNGDFNGIYDFNDIYDFYDF